MNRSQLSFGIWDLDEPRQLGLAGRSLHELLLTIIICLWLGLFAPLRFLEHDLQKLMIIRKIELRQFLDIEYDVLKKQRKVRDRLTRLCQPLCSLINLSWGQFITGVGGAAYKINKGALVPTPGLHSNVHRAGQLQCSSAHKPKCSHVNTQAHTNTRLNKHTHYTHALHIIS